jgi:hypothetical protein
MPSVSTNTVTSGYKLGLVHVREGRNLFCFILQYFFLLLKMCLGLDKRYHSAYIVTTMASSADMLQITRVKQFSVQTGES